MPSKANLLSQPRCIKRVNTLVDLGYNVEVYGYDNGLYSDNINDYKCNINTITKQKDRCKVLSIYSNIQLIKKACKHTGPEDIIYLFGIRLACCFKLLNKNNRYIYEQADLNYTKLKNKLLVTIFRQIDKNIIRKSFATILTSQGFVDYLFNKQVPSNVYLIENKLNNNLQKHLVDNRSIRTSRLRFGFVGFVRYPRTLLTFAKVVGEKFPQHEFHFYGEGISGRQARELCAKYENLFYHGEFKNPDDQPMIYQNIDISVVCYDPDSLNVRIADPNKLYESIVFKVPIVVSKRTFLEKKVLKWGVGYSVNAYDENSVEEYINSISDLSISNCIANMKKLNTSDLFDNTDAIMPCIFSAL